VLSEPQIIADDLKQQVIKDVMSSNCCHRATIINIKENAPLLLAATSLSTSSNHFVLLATSSAKNTLMPA